MKRHIPQTDQQQHFFDQHAHVGRVPLLQPPINPLEPLLSNLHNIHPIHHLLHLRIRPLIRHRPLRIPPQSRKLAIPLLLRRPLAEMHRPAVRSREFHQSIRALHADLLINPQSPTDRPGGRIREFRQTYAQHACVFDRLRSALRHMR